VNLPVNKKKNCLQLLFVMVISYGLLTGNSFATIALMTDEELKTVDGQVSEIRLVTHNTENDTVRIFLDIHQEVYGSIESARAGYYYRDAAELATTPMEIGLSGFEGYYHGVDTINNGANFAFMKIISDFNTMSPMNGARLEPWGNGAFDSSTAEKRQNTTTRNCNNFDWDIWVDNLELGESPDKPLYTNGLIIRFEFDDNLKTSSNNAHLERVIIGTNDSQGIIKQNAQRITAIMNPLLLTNTTNRSAGIADPYDETGGSQIVVRDPMVQSYGAVISNVEDRDTGSWLIIDFSGDHLKFSLVMGFPENGTNFNATGPEGTVGYQNVDLWDPGWAPNGNRSGMAGSDPYETTRQAVND